MNGITLCLAALWGGMWWRFRGGALTTLTGFDPGTGGMRAIAAGAMSLPLVLLGGLWWFTMIPALWIGWSSAGWGAFQSMGASPVEEKNEIAHFLSKFMSRVPMCIVGMAIEGWLTLALPGAMVGLIDDSAVLGAMVALTGIVLSPVYLIWQRMPKLPDAGRFAKAATEWAEVSVGAIVQTVLVAAAIN